MNKAIASLAMMTVFAMTSAVWAAGNQVYIDQIGSNSNITATQTGTDNTITNEAGSMYLRGNNQNITVQQIGSNNYADLTVQGSGASVESTVNGNLDTVHIQCGTGAAGVNSACTDTKINADATGSHNTVNITAGAKSNMGTTLSGDRNTVNITSSTTNLLGATASVTATGSDNNITLSQNGAAGATGFSSSLDLTGSSNTVGVSQSGTVDSTVSIKTMGSNNNITVSSSN